MSGRRKQPAYPQLKPANFERGEVILVDLSDVAGEEHEMHKVRPAVNIQGDVANEKSPTVTIVPFSSSQHLRQSDIHILIASEEAGIDRSSFALCDQVSTISKKRVRGRLKQLKTSKMKKIYEGIDFHFDRF